MQVIIKLLYVNINRKYDQPHWTFLYFLFFKFIWELRP